MYDMYGYYNKYIIILKLKHNYYEGQAQSLLY